MAIDYFLVELSEDLSANENAVVSIAKSFKIDEQRARIILSKAPGPVTKPIVRGEAELIAKRFKDAGAKVLIRKTESEVPKRDITSAKAIGFGKELISSRKASSRVPLSSQNLLKDSGEWQSELSGEENKDIYTRRLFFSALLVILGLIGFILFYFYVNLKQEGFSFAEIDSWKQQYLLFVASLVALLVGIPTAIFYLKRYFEEP